MIRSPNQSLLVIQHNMTKKFTKAQIDEIGEKLDAYGIPWVYLPEGLEGHGIPISDPEPLKKLLTDLGPDVQAGIKALVDHIDSKR